MVGREVRMIVYFVSELGADWARMSALDLVWPKYGPLWWAEVAPAEISEYFASRILPLRGVPEQINKLCYVFDACSKTNI